LGREVLETLRSPSATKPWKETMQLSLLNAPRAARKPVRGPLRLKWPTKPKKPTPRIIPKGWTMPPLRKRRAWAERFMTFFDVGRFKTIMTPLEGAEHLIEPAHCELKGWRYSSGGLVFYDKGTWTANIPEYMSEITASGPQPFAAAIAECIERNDT
jgi:hypothetical protein